MRSLNAPGENSGEQSVGTAAVGGEQWACVDLKDLRRSFQAKNTTHTSGGIGSRSTIQSKNPSECTELQN